ncbi:MAG: phosphate ABC transporter permease PstA [bacterium]
MNRPPLHQAGLHLRRNIANKLMWVCCIGATLIALVPLGMIMFYLLDKGLPNLTLSFFTQLPKPVGEVGGGMKHAIIGTLELIGIASAFGLPIGLLGGIYLAEFGNNKIGGVIRFTADILASVPSIVIGMLVYTIVVLPRHQFSALAGGIALGIMMIPTVTRTTEEMIRMVPMALREAALSLGVSRVRTIFTVVITAARGGIITGVLLAIARIAGETAPLLFTAFGSRYFSTDINKPIASLPKQIFDYASGPYPSEHAQAWTGALVLVSLILILSAAARYATRGNARMVR